MPPPGLLQEPGEDSEVGPVLRGILGIVARKRLAERERIKADNASADSE